MMKKPVLVIMAAGMGSRYGGLKQIDPIDEEGHIIIDFSIYDAIEAGFDELVFIIKREDEREFRECIGNRMEKIIKVNYAYQELDVLPEGFHVPAGRKKPYGTGHAILCCKDVIHGPFAVINADDYYGKHAYKMMYDFLCRQQDDDKYHYAMVGYVLENTLTEHGHVARGICEVSEDGYLQNINERTRIEIIGDEVAYTEDEGKSYTLLSKESTVSMNLWGFGESILSELEKQFVPFLEENFQKNPLKCEYFLPSVVDKLLKEQIATVEVMKSFDRWYGVTYREDKEQVVEAIKGLKVSGLYPKRLWGE
ncbi:nucleotidyltransferase family protein [Velocimicrobium porci]|uniref:Nucleotidyltransferase n=1 Tax=Velocimicrobium porci TaxID=2606634 RepID=A0A6L5XVD2_9FIRM|nr:sugar phosphate nucleotidyltransferase [Velocimicrobium porci]MSS62338.1 nucleotidyltransferase [Velocimicrobium porci]